MSAPSTLMRPPVRLEQADDQVDEGALPDAGGADDADRLAAADREAHVLEHGAVAALVGVRHALELEPLAERTRRRGDGGHGIPPACLDEIGVDAVDRGAPDADLAQEPDDTVRGRDDAKAGVGIEAEERDAFRARAAAERRQQDHEQRARHEDRLHDDARHGRKRSVSPADASERALIAREGVGEVVPAAEHLDLFDAAQRLLKVSKGRLTERVEPAPETDRAPARRAEKEPRDGDEDDRRDHRHTRRDREQDDENAERDQNFRCKAESRGHHRAEDALDRLVGVVDQLGRVPSQVEGVRRAEIDPQHRGGSRSRRLLDAASAEIGGHGDERVLRNVEHGDEDGRGDDHGAIVVAREPPNERRRDRHRRRLCGLGDDTDEPEDRRRPGRLEGDREHRERHERGETRSHARGHERETLPQPGEHATSVRTASSRRPNAAREKCCATWARPARPMRAAPAESPRSRASASAKASAVGAQRKPVSPCTTVSAGPPPLTATTGRPAAIASTGT